METIEMLNRQDLLDKAIEIARKVHDGQVDKAGKPYLDHPLPVMNAMDTLEEKIVAVLHDAIEDCDRCRRNPCGIAISSVLHILILRWR